MERGLTAPSFTLHPHHPGSRLAEPGVCPAPPCSLEQDSGLLCGAAAGGGVWESGGSDGTSANGCVLFQGSFGVQGKPIPLLFTECTQGPLLELWIQRRPLWQQKASKPTVQTQPKEGPHPTLRPADCAFQTLSGPILSPAQGLCLSLFFTPRIGLPTSRLSRSDPCSSMQQTTFLFPSRHSRPVQCPEGKGHTS